MIYLASPYSHPDAAVRQLRFEKVRELTAELLKSGAVVFSPIVYGHMIATEFKLPGDAKYWFNFNRAILRHASSMIVYQLDGWRESKGVQQEISLATELGIPVGFECV